MKLYEKERQQMKRRKLMALVLAGAMAAVVGCSSQSGTVKQPETQKEAASQESTKENGNEGNTAGDSTAAQAAHVSL